MPATILIVDDETDFCLIVKNYLTRKGYQVSIANTLGDGLQMVMDLRPDILFLDNNLPDGSGWDSVEKIVEMIPQSKICLISAHRFNSPLDGTNANVQIWEKPISLEFLNKHF